MENILPSTVKHVSKELHDLVNNPPEGIHVTLNEADMTDIQAVIEGPEETPYVGGQFRIRMVLSQSYPREPPKGFFVTKIFHPNIQPTTGEICVNTMKRDWRPNLGIKHLMLTIKCLLIVPNPESALNEEAGRLLLEEYDEYARRARLFTDIHARANLLEQKKCGHQTGSALGKTGNAGDGVDSVAILRDSSHNTEGPLAKKRAGEKDGVVGGSQGVPGSSAPGSTSSGVAAVKKSAASKKSLRRL